MSPACLVKLNPSLYLVAELGQVQTLQLSRQVVQPLSVLCVILLEVSLSLVQFVLHQLP